MLNVQTSCSFCLDYYGRSVAPLNILYYKIRNVITVTRASFNKDCFEELSQTQRNNKVGNTFSLHVCYDDSKTVRALLTAIDSPERTDVNNEILQKRSKGLSCSEPK